MTAGVNLLAQVLAPQPPPFALLHRPDSVGPGRLEVLVGEMMTPGTLADIPMAGPEPGDGGPGAEVLVVVPYRQVTERGYACVDDDAPLVALRVTARAVLPIADVLRLVPDEDITLRQGRFDIDDQEYAEIVRRIIRDEIGRGEGSNFVIKRSYTADITDYRPARALTLFRRLYERESGVYWTFLVHTGLRTLVGATPERHISLRDGMAVMNPISGTYRYPPAGPNLPSLMAFLDDGKENDELYMVVDEELKMMARVCETGGRVEGPYLREMARLAHTEYLITGRSNQDPRKILRETMFAPTVTGSPLANACRVISRYEPGGRGYYGGILALIGRDDKSQPSLDSAILIRTADIDPAGHVAIGVGATLVRHSDPASEVAETWAKVAGLLTALSAGSSPTFGEHPQVRAALRRRNADLSEFWLAGSRTPTPPAPNLPRPPLPAPASSMPTPLALAPSTPTPPAATLVGLRVLVVDAEDTFTEMIAHQLRSLGLAVTVRRFDEELAFRGHDLVVMGPGPGDPRDTGHPRIAHLYAAIGTLLADRLPFVAVCLSHQVLCGLLGLGLVRCAAPNQGTRREVDLFGERELVGFYNTFVAWSDDRKIDRPGIGIVEISRDAETGEVHALRGPHFASVQFHAESVLTRNGPSILANRIMEVLRP